MSSVDEQFLKDLEDCLKVADQLAEVDTEEARVFVSQQLQDLQKFLQKKQKDAETRVEEEMKKEEDEIEKLKQRIDRATKSDGTNESDIAYTDFGLLWTVLKDEYWQLAFNAYLSETDDSAKVILETLIAILKTSFNQCKKRAEESRKNIIFQVKYPGENAQQNRDLKRPAPDPVLDNICKKCQIKSTPFCLPSIQQAIADDVKADKLLAKHFKHQSKKILSKTIENYLIKCIEFSWIACFEEPEVRLVTMPNKECQAISSKFEGLERITYSNRKNYACVEWPAIVQGNEIKIPWCLFTINQPRPQPFKTHVDPSKDFRVTGIEGSDGQLINDPEDDEVNKSKVQTATDTVSSGHSSKKAGSEKGTLAKNGDNDETERAEKTDTKKVGNVKPGDGSKSGASEPPKLKPYKNTNDKISKRSPHLDF